MNAYNLVKFHKGDKWKIDLNTSLGHFDYLVLPICLTPQFPMLQSIMFNMT